MAVPTEQRANTTQPLDKKAEGQPRPCSPPPSGDIDDFCAGGGSQQRCVRFAPEPTGVKLTLGRWEMSEDERKALWYTEHDFYRIKKEVCSESSSSSKHSGPTLSLKSLIRPRGSSSSKPLSSSLSSATSSTTPVPVSCPRGLEMVPLQSLVRQRRLRNAVLFSVLKEQAAQRLEKTNDPLGLSYASLPLTQPTIDEAIARAATDAEDAMACYRANKEVRKYLYGGRACTSVAAAAATATSCTRRKLRRRSVTIPKKMWWITSAA